MYINLVVGIKCFVLLFALTITNNTCTSQKKLTMNIYVNTVPVELI